MSNSEDKKILGLNISAAARALQSEQYGGWYRDPWGYPELNPEFIRSLSQSDLGIEIKEKSVKFSAPPTFLPFDMPKGAFTTRPAVTQDIQSSIVYTAAALRLAPKIHSKLEDWIYGWRIRDGKFDTKNTEEWEKYISSRNELESDLHSAQTDLTSFFASINHKELIQKISSIAGKRPETTLMTEVLEAHNRLTSRSGLPQRSTASAILAQMAFSDIDELITARLSQGKIICARRWMDDMSFEGSLPELYYLLTEIQREGRRFGLEINSSKTKIMTVEEAKKFLANEAQETIKLPKIKVREAPMELFADYGPPCTTFYNYSRLDSLQKEALTAPEKCDRATLGRILKSLRYYEIFDHAKDWSERAALMPHAADKLGRYLLDAERRGSLSIGISDWCYRTLSSEWHISPWAAAQYAITVPSSELQEPLERILWEWLENPRSLQQVAVATDRLSRSHPGDFKVKVRSVLDNHPHPQYCRILALGLLSAGEPQSNVAKILHESRHNHLTYLFLRWSKWKPLATQEDFDASLQHT